MCRAGVEKRRRNLGRSDSVVEGVAAVVVAGGAAVVVGVVLVMVGVAGVRVMWWWNRGGGEGDEGRGVVGTSVGFPAGELGRRIWMSSSIKLGRRIVGFEEVPVPVWVVVAPSTSTLRRMALKSSWTTRRRRAGEAVRKALRMGKGGHQDVESRIKVVSGVIPVVVVPAEEEGDREVGRGGAAQSKYTLSNLTHSNTGVPPFKNGGSGSELNIPSR